MATIATQRPDLAPSSALSFVACNVGGDQVVADANTFIYVKNGSGGALTVTVDSPTLCSQGSTHDIVVNVPAGSERMIGPLKPERFADANGYAQITYSGITSLTIAAVRAA